MWSPDARGMEVLARGPGRGGAPTPEGGGCRGGPHQECRRIKPQSPGWDLAVWGLPTAPGTSNSSDEARTGTRVVPPCKTKIGQSPATV